MNRAEDVTFEQFRESREDAGEIKRLTAENARLEKERFKFETALMLIGQGYPDAAGIAKAAITK